MLACILMGLHWNTDAQFLKKLKKKLTDKVEQKIENKIDKETDKVIDSALVSKQKNNEIDIPKTFSFTSSIELEITTDENEKVSMEVLLGEYPDIYAMSYIDQQMDGGSVFNVFTPKSVTTFMNIPGMKIKKSVSQEEINTMSFSQNINEDEGEMTKTGASKTILGYSCEEYRYSNNGGSVSVWASKNFPIQNKKVSMLGMGKDAFPYGFVMEMDIKSGKDNGNIKVVKYNPNKNLIIKTNEYKSF